MMTEGTLWNSKLILERREGASIEPSKSLFRNDKFAAVLLLASDESLSSMRAGE